jgi:molybdate transport system regulatory protein
VIFLDSVEGDRHADADKMRALADIILGSRGNETRWESAIEKLKLSPARNVKLLDVLREQDEYLKRSRISLRTKVWLRRDGRVVFGEGLARLLRGIHSHGSLSRAAKDEGISYRHAWGDIKKVEERLGFKLLERSVGGKSGGGSSLTDKGYRLLEAYEKVKLYTIRQSDRAFEEMFSDIPEDA